MHHFQAVAVDNAIYLIGAMTGAYPNETPLEKVVVYYPESDTFSLTHTIPMERRRGAAGAVWYDGWIYVVGGITNGHNDGYQPWLDAYNPESGVWRRLPDAPHARDHFQAVVVGSRLYAAGGRTTSKATSQVFDLTIAEVDVFDLSSQCWRANVPSVRLPTERAGNMSFGWKGELIVGGGESTRMQAHSEVEVFNIATQSWSSWPSLQRGRHGSGFAVIDGYVYTASGCGNRGGSPELTSLERLRLPKS